MYFIYTYINIYLKYLNQLNFGQIKEFQNSNKTF